MRLVKMTAAHTETVSCS